MKLSKSNKIENEKIRLTYLNAQEEDKKFEHIAKEEAADYEKRTKLM